MKMKTPAALLLLSAFALAPASAIAQHIDVNPAGCRSREVGMDPASSKSVVRGGHHERREGHHEQRREGHERSGSHEERR